MRATTFVTLLIYFAASAALATTIPTLWSIARDTTRSQRAAIADSIAQTLERTGLDDDKQKHEALAALQAEHPTAQIMIDSGLLTGPIQRPDTMVSRRIGSHTILVRFQPELRLASIVRTALLAATAAAVGGIILGAMALFEVIAFLRESRPSAGRARDETRHLIEAMASSVRAMKGRETELRLLHDRARERADELATITATLVRSLSSGFIALDPDGRIVDMNQAARDLLRTPLDPAGMRPVEARLPQRFAEVLQGAADEHLALQRHEISEEDGLAIGLTTVPLIDAVSRHFGMLALFVDLSPVRQLEERVRQMQSLADLGEMSAGIAHEFRNSLSTILGYLKLSRRSALGPAVESGISRAEAEARDLSAAVDSLLAFTRPMEVREQEIDVGDLVVSIAERLRGLNENVRMEIEREPAIVSGDPALLSRAFENLIRNAFEAVESRGSEGKIEIRVRPGAATTVTIHDNGDGIDPAQAHRLFVPFHSTKPSGFGLGLAMTRKIIVLHGGSVSLQNDPCQGALVTVRFPSAPPLPAAVDVQRRYFS